MIICESCRKECNDFYHEQTDNGEESPWGRTWTVTLSQCCSDYCRVIPDTDQLLEVDIDDNGHTSMPMLEEADSSVLDNYSLYEENNEPYG